MSSSPFERRFVSERLPETGADESRKIVTDWLGWGDYLDAQVDGVVVPAGKWNAFFRLTKVDGDLSATTIDFDELMRSEVGNGRSNFTIDPSMAEPRIGFPEIPVPLILRRTSDNYLAAIQFHDFDADDYHDAVMTARTYFNIVSAQFSFLFHIPLHYSAACVSRADGVQNYGFRFHYPWPEVQLSAFGVETFSGVAGRLITLYAEGVQSNSNAYRFMCFYKIVDHILSKGGRLHALRNKHYPAAVWLEFNAILPAEPVSRYDADLVGKKYTYARDRYQQTRLRDAVAHVLHTSDAFEPLDPDHAAHYRAAASVCRLMAHHLIRIVGVNCKALGELGASNEELMEVFFPHTSRNT
jgi:hypothetical protein